MSTSSLLLPHEFHTASFLLFSNKELKELAMSLSACWYWAIQLFQSQDDVCSEVFPNFVAACCSLCPTKVSATTMEVTAPPSSPAISWICTRGTSSCFSSVPKQYGRARGLKVSLLYIACNKLILMTAGVESGPGTPVRHWTSALVVFHSSVSLLPSFFRFFLQCNANLSPQVPWLMMRSSSILSSEGALSSAGWLPSSLDPCLVSAPEWDLHQDGQWGEDFRYLRHSHYISLSVIHWH